MIARLSKKMASFFARNNVIKIEDEEVYEYGLQLLLSTVFNGIIALNTCNYQRNSFTMRMLLGGICSIA